MKRPFFAVLGGMGSLATESFIRLVNIKTHARNDQEYLDYVVFNDASVPDRTAFIVGESEDDPFPVIADDIGKATAMGASFIVLTCNTAHYFYDRFQELTDVPILHMPREAVKRLSRMYPAERATRVGFLGTVGSLVSGVYRRAVEEAGYTFVYPDRDLQDRITSLIYNDVKGPGKPRKKPYISVLCDMLDPAGPYACDALILGCTELSVLNEKYPLQRRDLPSVLKEKYPPHSRCGRLLIIDAQAVLADVTVEKAEKKRSDYIRNS